jgi:hypothetical protein
MPAGNHDKMVGAPTSNADTRLLHPHMEEPGGGVAGIEVSVDFARDGDAAAILPNMGLNAARPGLWQRTDVLFLSTYNNANIILPRCIDVVVYCSVPPTVPPRVLYLAPAAGPNVWYTFHVHHNDITI